METDTDIGSEEAGTATLLSEVITTPLISEMDNIRMRIIDFEVGMLPLTPIDTFFLFFVRDVTKPLFVASWVDKHLSDRIQSPHLRGPEFIIGAP